MKAIEKISQELLDNLQSPYIKSITLGDEDGDDIANDKSEQARKFAFNFVVDSVILGTVLVTLNADEKSLEVQFDHDMLKKVDQDYPELKPRAKKAWFDFLRKMRKFTSTTPDMTLDIINLTQNNLKKDSAMHTVDELKEAKMSKLAGSTKSSYQRVGENRLIIRHVGPIDEEKMGSRTRNIKSIYIENSSGERFLVKENSLIGARILSQHISHGGNLQDDFTNHLYTMIREMRDLKSFVLASRNKVFESSEANEMVQAATEYYKTLRETVRSLSTSRGYTKYLESFMPEAEQADIDTEALKEKFIVRSFSEKFEAALPHIAKAYQKKILEQNALYSEAQAYIDGDKKFGLTEADVALYKTFKFENGNALSRKVLEHISALLSDTESRVARFATESAEKFVAITESPEQSNWLHQNLAVDLVRSFVAEMNSFAEVAPPGAKAERMVKHIKKSLSKDGKLSDQDKAIAYATTWKAHNAGQVEEQDVAEDEINELSPGLLNRAAQAAKDKSKLSMDPQVHKALGGGYTNPVARHYDAKANKFRQGAADAEVRDKIQTIGISGATKRKLSIKEGYQLDEGAMETISNLVKKLPGIGKYYQIAQQYKPQLVQILQIGRAHV